MTEVNQLKAKVNTKTLHLVLLTIATGGIYPLLWMYRNCAEIEKVTKNSITSNAFIIWLAACVGLGGALAGTGEPSLDLVAGIITIASWVLYIVWAFKARTALQLYALNEHKTYLRMNSFYTFIFTIYYINFCINDLPEEVRKQQVISGTTGTESVAG